MNSLNNINYILFDLDSTIMDTITSETQAFCELFKKYNLEYSKYIHKQYSLINNKLWKDHELGLISSDQIRKTRFKILFDKIGYKFDFDIDKFSNDYFELFSKAAVPFPHAVETIKTLKKTKNIYLVSNGIGNVQRYKLKVNGILDCFLDTFVSDEVGASKPDYKFFDFVYNKIGKPNKSEVLVVGDRILSDIEGGKNYGFKTCHITSEETTIADLKLKSIYELLNLI